MEQIQNVDKQEEVYVKNIRINQKKRIKTVLIWLILFNLFLISSMVYLCVALNFLPVTLFCVIVYCLVLWRSVVTFNRAEIDISVKLYVDKIVIRTYIGETVIDLKNVYGVKARRSLLQRIFKSPANGIMLTVRDENVKRIFISFIENDIQKLCDKISLFAIRERHKASSENN